MKKTQISISVDTRLLERVDALKGKGGRSHAIETAIRGTFGDYKTYFISSLNEMVEEGRRAGIDVHYTIGAIHNDKH